MNLKALLVASLVINITIISIVFLIIDRLGGPNYLYFKIAHRNDNTGISLGRTEHLSLLDKEEGEIIFLGDSLTEEVEWSEVFHDRHVKNRGVGGDNVQRVFGRVSDILVSHPKAIFLMVGINDMISESTNQVLNGINNIVSKIRKGSPRTNVYIQTVFPVNNTVHSWQIRNIDIAQLNKQLIESWAANKDDKVKCVELYSQFVDKHGNLHDTYSFDGLHLNGAGISRWIQIIGPIVIKEQKEM